MKKFILGGLFAALLSLGICTTTVYAEGTEGEVIVSEMEIVEEVETPNEEVDENENNSETEVYDSVNDAEVNSGAVIEESELQAWFNEKVMPWLGIATAAGGGAGVVAAILAALFKWIIKKIESKLKEAYEKKADNEKDKEEFNVLIKELTERFDSTFDNLKQLYEQKGDNLQEATTAIHEDMMGIYSVVEKLGISNKMLENTVTAENKKLHELMQSEQKEMLKLTETDMKLITDILVIAFTNMPYLVSNGYATSIKKAVQNYEDEKQNKTL